MGEAIGIGVVLTILAILAAIGGVFYLQIAYMWPAIFDASAGAGPLFTSQAGLTGLRPLVLSLSAQPSDPALAPLNVLEIPQRSMPLYRAPLNALPQHQPPDNSTPPGSDYPEWPQKYIPPPPPPIKPPPPPIKPPPPVKRTPAPQQCPEGFEWDAATEQCVAIKPPPPPPNCPPGTTWNPETETCEPNPPPPPPTQPVNDPTQDEVEKCCSQSTYNAQLIQSQLNTIINKLTELAAQPIGAGGVSDSCCTEIVAALGASTQALAAIASAIAAIAPGAPSTVDLSAIVAALDTINSTLAAAPPEQGTDVSFLRALVERVPAVDAVIGSVLDRLNQAGVIDPQLAQLLAPPA